MSTVARFSFEAASRELIAKLVKAGYLPTALRHDADAITARREGAFVSCPSAALRSAVMPWWSVGRCWPPMAARRNWRCADKKSPAQRGGPHRGNNQLVETVTSAGSARQLCVRRPTPTNLEASFPPKEFAAIEARLPTASKHHTVSLEYTRSFSGFCTTDKSRLGLLYPD